ncbi:CD276 antigen-like [Paralichthys olivaceus]|uniref:CD276 antigen-like n=1 Tax=Paralichthys olivaceus TaxID=8255 RepID=UPI00375375E1
MMRVLLMITSLLLTGVWCSEDSVFVYSRVGGDALLPCSNPVPSNCSLISWTLYEGSQVTYTHEVIKGQVNNNSDKSGRLSITANCSLHFHDLRVDDVGSYICFEGAKPISNVYLSLLTISALSSIADLQPGGSLILSCILFSFYDTGTCQPYSNDFSLSWVTADGAVLPRESRYELISRTRCNSTLVTKLLVEDNHRKWRCQLNATRNSRAVFQDFTSSFLFQNPSTDQEVPPSSLTVCSERQHVSHIVLCVALPLMVITVGFFTWRGGRHRTKTSAAEIQMQQIS